MVSPHDGSPLPTPKKSRLSESEMQLRRLLKSSPQDLWLDTMRRTRPQHHDSLVYWMLNQTECDFAVAMHAFYRSNPARHVDDALPLPQRPAVSNIFALVLVNWDTGSFRNHRLQVEDIDADPRAVARVRQKLLAHPRGSLPFRLPQEFLLLEGGKPMKLAPNMHPDEVPHLWSLYASLGLKVHAAPPGFARTIARIKDVFRRFRFSGQQS